MRKCLDGFFWMSHVNVSITYRWAKSNLITTFVAELQNDVDFPENLSTKFASACDNCREPFGWSAYCEPDGQFADLPCSGRVQYTTYGDSQLKYPHLDISWRLMNDTDTADCVTRYQGTGYPMFKSLFSKIKVGRINEVSASHNTHE